MYKLIHLGKYAIENMAKVSKRKETITPIGPLRRSPVRTPRDQQVRVTGTLPVFL